MITQTGKIRCMHLKEPVQQARQSGFTLIEILIVIAIIGILASVAVPGYSKFIDKQHRRDAHHLLHANAQLLQRCLTLAGSFEAGCNLIETSDSGYYTLSSTLSPGEWSLTANTVDPGRQQFDTDCVSFTLEHTGRKTATGDNPDSCW